MKAYLILEDGTVFEGHSFGAKKDVFGEVVFNTGMTGYQEILTDPSYAGQIVNLTYPLIGNYGINKDDLESESIKVNGLIVNEVCKNESHYESIISLNEYLIQENIPGLCNIDTRKLTRKIRNKGAMKGYIICQNKDFNKDDYLGKLKNTSLESNLIDKVSIKNIKKYQNGKFKIGILDLGVKKSIIKNLISNNCEVTIYPHDTDKYTLLKDNLDAILISNGPGDPKQANNVIRTAEQLIGKIPLYGICLGHQILALALGADTYKLKFGHRGCNHPVINTKTNKVLITSQNHGYAVKADSLSEDIWISYRNINDGTVEGFECENLNIYTVQFHPEEGPGPHDGLNIFNEWLDKLKEGEC